MDSVQATAARTVKLKPVRLRLLGITVLAVVGPPLIAWIVYLFAPVFQFAINGP
jgi:hypothetical protein